MTKIVVICAMILCSAICNPQPAIAQVPELINYQGRVVESGALVNGSRTIEFYLYNQATLGSPIYAETQTVDVVDGLYSTQIGSDHPTPGALKTACGTSPLYLEIEVEDTKLSPRERIVAVGYAIMAGGVTNAAITSAMIRNGQVSNDDLAGNITDNKLFPIVTAGKVADSALSVNVSKLGQSIESSEITDGTISVADIGQNGAGAGEVLKWDGAWAPAPSLPPGYVEVGTFSTGPQAYGTDSIAQGAGARADGLYASVGGGQNNEAGSYAVVPGGLLNVATGFYSFAAGLRAKARHHGSFVWGDNTDADFDSTDEGQFLIRANGGVGIGTAVTPYPLTVNGDVQATAFRGSGANLTGIVIPDNSITSAKIVDGTITTHDVGTGAIGSPNIADGGVFGWDIADDTIGSQHLIDAAVASNHIRGDAVDSYRILDNSIESIDIKDGAIDTQDIDNDSITTDHLINGAVQSPDISDNTVASVDILNGTVGTVDLNLTQVDGRYYTKTLLDGGQLNSLYVNENQANSISSAMITDGQVSVSDLNTLSVDARYVSPFEADSITDGMVALLAVRYESLYTDVISAFVNTSGDTMSGNLNLGANDILNADMIHANSSVEVGSSNVKVHYGNTGLFGAASGWDPNPSAGAGLWLEFGISESSGFYSDDDTACIWSAGDQGILRVYDEDSLPGGSPAFVIDGQGDVGIAVTSPSYDLQLANNDAGKPGGGSWTDSSDARLKTNVQALEGALDKLIQLRGVTFEWRNPEIHGQQTGVQAGLIAQEVEAVFPEWVAENPAQGEDIPLVGDDAQMKTLQFPHGFNAYVIEALKELKAENDALRQELEELKSSMAQ